MATSSIFNNIKVKDKRFCKSLVKALEDAKEVRCKEVIFSKSVKALNEDQIINIFGEENSDRI